MIRQDMILITAMILFLLVISVLIFLISKRFRKDFTKSSMDEMEGLEFEHFCAELLKRNGFCDVEVTKGSGDYGIDIFAEKDGVSYGIQCKCYQEPVGVKAIQEAYAGKEYYEKMVGAVMTNQYFTSPAVEAAKKLRILLWDRGYLDHMMEEYR
ncbi:MAG: restriction endonuclease [Lachnospiraceae bacterium]|nr:restriction endonuclease [Lachnospiraceae bacterium]MDD3659513.1 restriction endonuclease [Lachnospiraceae bacterium]